MAARCRPSAGCGRSRLQGGRPPSHRGGLHQVAPKGNQLLGRLDQKGKHRKCASLRLDGTRATLPPDSEFQTISDHFRLPVGSWDCNPKPVIQRPAPTSHSAHHCRANLGSDSKWHCTFMFMRDRKPGSARKASIHPESAAAASQPSEQSEQSQNGRDPVGTLQAAQQHPLDFLLRCARRRNFKTCCCRRLCMIRVHSTAAHPASEKLRPVCLASPISGPVSNSRPLLLASSGCPTTTAPRTLLCGTTLLDGRIDEPWQPRPSRVRCPHQRRTLRHRVALETLPRPHTPSTSPG